MQVERDYIDFSDEELSLIRSHAAQIRRIALDLSASRNSGAKRISAFDRAIFNYFFWVEEDAKNIQYWADSALKNDRTAISSAECKVLSDFRKRLKKSCDINDFMHTYSLLPADISDADRAYFDRYAKNFMKNLFALPMED